MRLNNWNVIMASYPDRNVIFVILRILSDVDVKTPLFEICSARLRFVGRHYGLTIKLRANELQMHATQ